MIKEMHISLWRSSSPTSRIVLSISTWMGMSSRMETSLTGGGCAPGILVTST